MKAVQQPSLSTDSPQRLVYHFGGGSADGDASMRDELGGKGANLAEMSALGLPVPPGFTIPTSQCIHYYDNNKTLPDALKQHVALAMQHVETHVNAHFGAVDNPLLVSVRSGARASMPGMMDTVLNLGLNDETVQGLAKKTGNERFAYDSYRRFIQMYADVVLGVEHYYFEEILESMKLDTGAVLDTELDANALKELVELYKNKVADLIGAPFPQDVHAQLWGAVLAVFDSWMNQRAITYRMLHDIPESWGTAVTVQAMVFGNMGDDCATGVAFTRNPSTGEAAIYGEYLINAQGEDVVAGIRTPQSLTVAGKDIGDDLPAMQESMPALYDELCTIFTLLEAHYRDMQDIEFTVQSNKLWLLQTRGGKRTAAAAIRIAVDMANDGLISRDEALQRVDPLMLDQLLHPTLDPDAARHVITKGLPASPGAASGEIVFSADAAEARVKAGVKVLLVRLETSPEDIHGMHVSEGILTARGGMTSHAAVVARGMGKPCVSGVAALKFNAAHDAVTINGTEYNAGDMLTIDGAMGDVILGEVPTIQPALSGYFATLMEWADAVRTMEIRTNADTATDAAQARQFGAQGIGLCRTEHMFFDADRILAMRAMILADSKLQREQALEALLPMQRQDFVDIFAAMEGLPVTIRLLDPPLHEFLPHSDTEIAELADYCQVTPEAVKQRADALSESNPMLGHRGCRLGITYPEIYQMQVRAILEAALEAQRVTGGIITPEIMVPLVMSRAEIAHLKLLIDATATALFEQEGASVAYHIGTMIELPRAALRAGDIAQSAEFFSFGTNDLTQTTFGISRDDAGSFLGYYKRKGLSDQNPFVSIDVEGVGELVAAACLRGRETNPDITLGVCGEHGGDPASIRFFQSVGLNYVSCSPYRVPIARLAAAQAVLLLQTV